MNLPISKAVAKLIIAIVEPQVDIALNEGRSNDRNGATKHYINP